MQKSPILRIDEVRCMHMVDLMGSLAPPDLLDLPLLSMMYKIFDDGDKGQYDLRPEGKEIVVLFVRAPLL